MDTWISHLHQHGTLIMSLSRLEIKTKPVGFGLFEILSKSVAVLKGNIGAIYSIRYSADGQYMAMAEAADFVHVYDAKNGYERNRRLIYLEK